MDKDLAHEEGIKKEEEKAAHEKEGVGANLILTWPVRRKEARTETAVMPTSGRWRVTWTWSCAVLLWHSIVHGWYM